MPDTAALQQMAQKLRRHSSPPPPRRAAASDDPHVLRRDHVGPLFPRVRFDPKNPARNVDEFVLSKGHAARSSGRAEGSGTSART